MAVIMDIAAERKKRVETTFQLDPTVSITLKKKNLTLELNNWAVKGVLKDTGHNLMSAGFRKDQMENPEIMGSILFHALRTNHPDMTQEDVDKLYTFRHFPYVIMKLQECMDLFMPDMSDIDTPASPAVELQDSDPTKPVM